MLLCPLPRRRRQRAPKEEDRFCFHAEPEACRPITTFAYVFLDFDFGRRTVTTCLMFHSQGILFQTIIQLCSMHTLSFLPLSNMVKS
jgi:hypothetical protein